MQVSDCAARRQVPANLERVLGLHGQVEFPIADRRLRHGKIRAVRRRLRRRPPGQTDRDQIEVLQQRTVR